MRMPGVGERGRRYMLGTRRVGAMASGGVMTQTVTGPVSPVFYLEESEIFRSRGTCRDQPRRTPLRRLPQRAPLARVHGPTAGRSRAGGHVRRVSSPLRRRAAGTISRRADRSGRGPGGGPHPGRTRTARSGPRRSREKGAPRAAQRGVHHRKDRQGRRATAGQDASPAAPAGRIRRDPRGRQALVDRAAPHRSRSGA
jgi:hypothetical protein